MILKKIIQGDSLTIGFRPNTEYDQSHLQHFYVHLGTELLVSTLTGGIIRVEMSATLTTRYYGVQKLYLTIDDSSFGTRRTLIGEIEFIQSTGTFNDTSVNTGYSLIIGVTINELTTTTDPLLLEAIKGLSAYEIAVEYGYIGTEAQWNAEFLNNATVAGTNAGAIAGAAAAEPFADAAALSAIAAQLAETNAETAETNAELAETNAETAQGLSEDARDASIAAKNLSVTAQQNAELAESHAETAESNAETAQGLSESARDTSIAAKDTAVAAAGTATTKAGEASGSAAAALQSKNYASGYADAAELAKLAAQTAETNAELAETNAETAEANAETAETNAEAAQLAAESARDITVANTVLLGTIAHNAAAPEPAASGYYIFTTTGTVAWITGTPTVRVSDRVVVIYTAPSTYTYTHLDMEETNVDGGVASSLYGGAVIIDGGNA